MTTQTLTITAFLLARIADDEAMAHAAQSAGRWALAENIAVALNNPTGHVLLDPARVLTECAAKKAIVTTAKHAAEVEGGGAEDATGEVLRHLASVYSDHPDFNPDWA